MIKFNVNRIIILSAAVAVFSPVASHAQQSGERRGPPSEAIDACAGQVEGAACSFTGRRGAVNGMCVSPPAGVNSQDGAGQLACAPDRKRSAGNNNQ